MNKILKKYWIVVFALLMIMPLSSSAQGRFEIAPFGGYMFGGKFRFYEGELKIENAADYGVNVNIEVARDTKLEFFWAQMQTTAYFRPYYGYEFISTDPFNLTVNYYQIGSLREMEIDNENIKPFGVFTLGATHFKPTTRDLTDNWQFSITLGGGIKIWFSEVIGLRLQGRLMMPMYFGGVGFYAGSGGSGLSVGAGSAVIQGDFTGGLIFAFGNWQ